MFSLTLNTPLIVPYIRIYRYGIAHGGPSARVHQSRIQYLNMVPLYVAPSFLLIRTALDPACVLLQELLVNEVLRTQADPTAEDGTEASPSVDRQRFCRAVWELHSKIFQSYVLWLRNVELKHVRNCCAEAMLVACSWDAPEAVNGLLTELATYFLVRTDASYVSSPFTCELFPHSLSPSLAAVE